MDSLSFYINCFRALPRMFSVPQMLVGNQAAIRPPFCTDYPAFPSLAPSVCSQRLAEDHLPLPQPLNPTPGREMKTYVSQKRQQELHSPLSLGVFEHNLHI